jgi:hypothetical protein
MDNATRKELLYKARAVGYPGSILDVFANYDQGKDLIGEFQQQQQMQQQMQMSDIAAQQSGLEQPQQQMQQPQQQGPQMPVVPSSPTPAPNFTPPQPTPPIGVQSQDSPMGIVSGQSGPNQGRAIFATGGFSNEGPGCPEGQFKNTAGECVPLFPETNFRGKNYFESDVENTYCQKFPHEGGCIDYNNPKAFANGHLGNLKSERRYHVNSLGNYNPEDLDSSGTNIGDLAHYAERFHFYNTKAGEQKPLTFQEFNDITSGKAENELFNSSSPETKKILNTLDQKSIQDEIGKRLEESKRMSQNANPAMKKNVADEEGKFRVIGGDNITADFKKIKTYKESKKLGGAKCYTCVGRKRRV